jgi:glycosyltransferase involved in cell wall biosynthesis
MDGAMRVVKRGGMMRVLHVLGELRASGAEVGLEKASGLWKQFGIECDILAIGDRRGAFAENLERAGYGVNHLPYTADFRLLAAYGRLVRCGRYDIVHIHLERAFVYYCLAARLARAKVVRTVRAYYPFEGALARRRSIQRRVAQVAGTRFVAISPSVAANERERFANATVQIDNWIDTDYFQPPSDEQRQRGRRDLGVSEDSIAITTVGNCAPLKNHMALLEALASMQEIPWVWLHVGDEEAAKGERSRAAALGVADRCRFLGRRDPLVSLHAADVFVMPSLSEGLGMATIEALCTGLPALLTDVPGNRDMSALDAATVFCGSDSTSLVDGLHATIRCGSRREQGDRSLQHDRVARRYGAERGVSAYAELYSVMTQ